MTLKEKFESIETNFTNNGGYDYYQIDHETSEQCEKIAEDFAIGFVEWCDNIKIGEWSDKTTKELLEIYKKEKGL